MNNVTPEQFAESVRSAIGTVNQFYGQIDRLNSLLKAALTSGQDRFTVLGGIPPQPGKRKDARVIRHDYGYLYHADASEGDDDDDYEGGIDEESESDEEGKTPRRTLRSFQTRRCWRSAPCSSIPSGHRNWSPTSSMWA
jgi:hypothetical protein